jgi:beta-lactamase regulating signal transducer with metallopeptidase domain
MNALMVTIISLSLSGSIFIAILFLCKPLYRERLSKSWQYYVWLIVVMRLLFPISMDVNIIGNLFNGIRQTHAVTYVTNIESTRTTNITIANNEGQTITPAIPGITIDLPYGEVGFHENQAASSYQIADIIRMIWSNLWLVWLIVAVALLVRKITIYQSFVRYIKAGRVEVSDIENLERFGKIVEQANIKRVVGMYTNNLISSPMLIGFFRSYIVLPSLNISESDFRHTILHELTHYKRGDMFYKWLVQLTICLHWFNPLVHLMGREINNACEFSCDESVISSLNYHEIRAYGDTLLNAMDTGGKFKNSLSSVTLTENKKILKERLNMIQNFKKKSRFITVIAVLVTMLLSTGAIAVGAYAMTSQSPVADGNNALYVGISTSLDPNITTGRPTVELFKEYEEWGITFEGFYPYSNHNSRFMAREAINVFHNGQLIRGISDFCEVAGLSMSISSAIYEGNTWISVIRDESGYITKLDISSTKGIFSFEIPHIAAGEVALIGRVYLDPDNPVTVFISEYESEHGFFLGLSDSSDVQTKVGTHWIPFFGNESVDNNRFIFTSDYARIAYLYIGSGHGTSSIIGQNVYFDNRSNVGNRHITNVVGRVYGSNEESAVHKTVEIDIPKIYTTPYFVPHNPLFIESLVLYPGDIITFDMSADIGSPFVGLSSVKFTDPTNQWVTVGNSGIITVEGTQPQYVFVFVQANIDESVSTSLSGTITIERASE